MFSRFLLHTELLIFFVIVVTVVVILIIVLVVILVLIQVVIFIVFFVSGHNAHLFSLIFCLGQSDLYLMKTHF